MDSLRRTDEFEVSTCRNKNAICEAGNEKLIQKLDSVENPGAPSSGVCLARNRVCRAVLEIKIKSESTMYHHLCSQFVVAVEHVIRFFRPITPSR